MSEVCFGPGPQQTHWYEFCILFLAIVGLLFWWVFLFIGEFLYINPVLRWIGEKLRVRRR